MTHMLDDASHSGTTTDVTLIGTGTIGSALAATLLRSHTVTVWNRTHRRTDQLQSLGAVTVESVEAATAASPLCIVCLLDYSTVRAVLDVPDVRETLRGRTLVVHTTGSAAEAREMAAWAAEHQIDYLDGVIGCYPSELGTERASTFYAGSSAVYQRHESLLQSVGGEVTYLGAEVGHPALLEQTELVFFFSAILSFVQMAAMAEAEGMPVTDVLRHIKRRWWITEQVLEGTAERIVGGRYSAPESTLDLDLAAARGLVTECRRLGLDTSLVDLVASRLDQAARTYGDGDIAATYEFVKASRKPAQPSR